MLCVRVDLIDISYYVSLVSMILIALHQTQSYSLTSYSMFAGLSNFFLHDTSFAVMPCTSLILPLSLHMVVRTRVVFSSVFSLESVLSGMFIYGLSEA